MQASSATLPTAASESRAAQSLPAALLLSFTGGFLDAFLYVAHGGVFAGALTGNVILAGIALLHHNTADITLHILPIAAFIAGICCAFYTGIRLCHHTVLVALALESIGLLVASFLPHSFPDWLFIILLSGLAGYQVGSFRKVESFLYNATFITGSIVRAVEAFHAIQLGIDPEESRRALRDLGSIVILFAVGVIAAVLLAVRIYNRALLVPMTAVLIVLAMAFFGNLHHPEPAGRKAGEPN